MSADDAPATGFTVTATRVTSTGVGYSVLTPTAFTQGTYAVVDGRDQAVLPRRLDRRAGWFTRALVDAGVTSTRTPSADRRPCSGPTRRKACHRCGRPDELLMHLAFWLIS